MSEDLEEFSISKSVKKKLKNTSWVKKQLSEGKTPQEILGFSDTAMAKFYQAARTLLEANRYTEASNAFLFLVTLNSYNHDYWLGLGMSLQICKEYEAAINAYEMAASSKIESPVPYFYLAKCLFAVHDRETALEALQLAIDYADEIEEYRDLKEKALEAKKILLKGDS